MAALYTQVGIPSSDNYRFSLRDPCCSNSNASNTHFFHGTSSTKIRNGRSSRRILVKSLAFWKPKAEKPSSVELKPISSEEQFDQILSESQQSSHAVIIDWMAQWCRKCIYLKPKLEKLGAEFYPEIQFYCVDVNAVPKALVERGGISKMPTIQLWRNGAKRAEVIGGHKAWMVLDEIRDMINKN